MVEIDAPEFSDEDKDSLHILPLGILPLKTKGMNRPRLLKNARFETVIEMFQDSTAGSGQIDINGIPDYFDAAAPTFGEDYAIIDAMAEAPSYDVFTLRLLLRSHNINITNSEHLNLSASMQVQLTNYMKVFTRPLVKKVFGDDTRDVSSAAEIVEMFREIDRDEAIKRLKIVSDALGLSIEQIPGFLEDYGDTFLSLSYFKRSLDEIRPVFESMREWIKDGIYETHIRHNPEAIKAAKLTEGHVGAAFAFIVQRFAAFDQISRDFWEELSNSRYEEMRHTIHMHHRTIGGMLCGLSVKMAQFQADFPTAAGSPQKRVDWLLSEMLPGLDRIRALENDVPKLAEIR